MTKGTEIESVTSTPVPETEKEICKNLFLKNKFKKRRGEKREKK